MGKAWIAIGVVLVTLVAGAMGYTIASAVLTFKALGFSADIDFGYIAQNYLWIRDRRPDDFQLINLIIGGSAVAGLMMSLAMSGSALTRFGQTHWQKRGEMKANGFFGKPGTGFILGKLGSPKSRARYITSKVFPHALIVAPTGRGKTSGFVIPNLLTWQGSAVTLDVKGECFEATARHRAAQGDKVYRFAPTDWEGKRTHRYNPLLRIYELKDPARQQMELQLLATLFLQSDNDRVQGLLKGGIDLFVAAGLLAFQRKKPNLGEIYRIAASGGNKQKEYVARAHEIDNKAAKLIFTRLASTNNDTLTSYVSLLMTSGLDQWQNPAIDEATQVSDFDFRTIRKKPFTVYLVVQPLMVKPLAPLIRLFFSDLLSAMQEKEPGKDEPWPVMIMLDEFNRLGKMPIVVESIETLRTYRGHLAVVTQTIPALDEIYGENTRRALQGNAGVKLYLTPSDEKTVEELSKAVGKTTKTVVTRSRSIGKNPFEGRSQSTRTEETSLLPEDEARRLPLDEIIMVVDAQMPVRAKRIQYFDDRMFAAILGAQKGELPFPEMNGGSQGGSGSGASASNGTRSRPEAGTAIAPRDVAIAGKEVGVGVVPTKPTTKTAPVVQAVVAGERRQIEMDLGVQSAEPVKELNDVEAKQYAGAVDELGDLETSLERGEAH
ncbi:type IV secretory system conjugative DNA transfer family protein [Sulfitobacter geojensis]|uniref:Type IV secretory system conjugative DNA transfer family protein n=1 Tax=Sulfitobacter geojensis TaxID=1342299 RepID=A0AAE2W2J4_9RHOB|nr:type IV secretory system conjugative DNA transfer family protein [Sulfitobacter geojensis]MBM1691151.1 type IV secretory system conjugative DNA transfer family protein [Sulfitobacter geojensis]MBM1695217.1 type IV secretory system conjugative DNA transfer family protein [Sulfitobacter geojensis]MBM1707317.1 type IV secretory system conjugative DNA transfer family protein [Sulfitobacter geojensis]MBM1711467.1 type IV secretory system conjugative DNA transfer family protein [Sulfitobacter geoj